MTVFISLSVTFGTFGDLPLLTLNTVGFVIILMKTLKVRIEPNSSQREVIDHMIDANRLVYNGLLVACKQVFAKERKLPSVFDLNKVATWMRHKSPYVEDSYSTTLNETAKRVHNACKKTLDVHRIKHEELILDPFLWKLCEDHFPRFKPKGQFNSFTYPTASDYSVEYVKKNGKKKRILKLGKVPGLLRCYNQDTIIEGKLKTCTIKRKNLGSHFEYYAFIVIEDEPKQYPESTKGPVGVDIGVSNIAALSDGTVFPNDRIFAKMKKRLAKLQRQLSRALFGSDKYRKLQTGINHLYEKIQNHRKNNTETISAYIVKNHDIIGMEDLSVRALRKKAKTHTMANGYNDASLGTLVRRIKDKASSAGRIVILVDPKDTSQLCSQCGSIVKKDLGTRVHSCPFCGFTADRDVNAAKNILRRALAKIRGMDRPSRSPQLRDRIARHHSVYRHRI